MNRHRYARTDGQMEKGENNKKYANEQNDDRQTVEQTDSRKDKQIKRMKCAQTEGLTEGKGQTEQMDRPRDKRMNRQTYA